MGGDCGGVCSKMTAEEFISLTRSHINNYNIIIITVLKLWYFIHRSTHYLTTALVAADVDDDDDNDDEGGRILDDVNDINDNKRTSRFVSWNTAAAEQSCRRANPRSRHGGATSRPEVLQVQVGRVGVHLRHYTMYTHTIILQYCCTDPFRIYLATISDR